MMLSIAECCLKLHTTVGIGEVGKALFCRSHTTDARLCKNDEDMFFSPHFANAVVIGSARAIDYQGLKINLVVSFIYRIFIV